MKKEKGPLLYIGQPKFQPVQPVMQKIAKASESKPVQAEDAQPIQAGEIQPAIPEKAPPANKESRKETGRLKPFRDMNVEEKVVYLAERRIPVPCRFEWKNGSARGIIERFDKESVWVTEEDSEEAVQIPISEIVYIRIAGT